MLVELARLLPELPPGQPDPARLEPQEGPGASSRFLDGLRQALVGLLAGAPPGVLFMDDLQWADSASLELLAFLVRRLPGTPLFILATWRNDSLAATPGLSALLGEAQRLGVAVRLGLSRLAAADVDELLASLAQQSQAVPAGFSQRLYQETEGLPFFLVEYLASLFQDGGLSPGAEWNLPASVRDVLNTRLADLNETASQLLSTAAVIGRSFDFATLQAASGRSELEAVAGLETLLASGLILERRGQSAPGESDYDFTHEKLRSLVYESTSLARRRLLHRRVAETLAGPAPGRADSGSLAAQIAGHYHLAGQDALAAGYFKSAGDAARLLFANNEALSHYRAALAAGYPDAAELHTAIGDLYVLRGEYEAAISAYETAAALCAPIRLALHRAPVRRGARSPRRVGAG